MRKGTCKSQCGARACYGLNCFDERCAFIEWEEELAAEETQLAYVKAELKTPNISFNNQHNESVGTLYWEDNLMKFKGDVHESAKVLFAYVCSMWNAKGKEDE